MAAIHRERCRNMSTLLQTGSESPVHRPLPRASASAALGIPHEVRLKLAKRMRDEQLRRYYEREGRLQQEKEEDAVVDYDGPNTESRGDSEQNREKKQKSRTRMVAFEEKEMLLDAVQNGDTSEGIVATCISTVLVLWGVEYRTCCSDSITLL